MMLSFGLAHGFGGDGLGEDEFMISLPGALMSVRLRVRHDPAAGACADRAGCRCWLFLAVLVHADSYKLLGCAAVLLLMAAGALAAGASYALNGSRTPISPGISPLSAATCRPGSRSR